MSVSVYLSTAWTLLKFKDTLLHFSICLLAVPRSHQKIWIQTLEGIRQTYRIFYRNQQSIVNMLSVAILNKETDNVILKLITTRKKRPQC